MSVLIDSLAEARAKIAARLVEVESEARQAREAYDQLTIIMGAYTRTDLSAPVKADDAREDIFSTITVEDKAPTADAEPPMNPAPTQPKPHKPRQKRGVKLVSDTIHERMDAKKLTIKELADRLHYHYITINGWLTEKYCPDREAVETLADILGCEVEDIITNVECDE